MNPRREAAAAQCEQAAKVDWELDKQARLVEGASEAEKPANRRIDWGAAAPSAGFTAAEAIQFGNGIPERYVAGLTAPGLPHWMGVERTAPDLLKTSVPKGESPTRRRAGLRHAARLGDEWRRPRRHGPGASSRQGCPAPVGPPGCALGVLMGSPMRWSSLRRRTKASSARNISSGARATVATSETPLAWRTPRTPLR